MENTASYQHAINTHDAALPQLLIACSRWALLATASNAQHVLGARGARWPEAEAQIKLRCTCTRNA
jgi:hypothetical protein